MFGVGFKCRSSLSSSNLIRHRNYCRVMRLKKTADDWRNCKLRDLFAEYQHLSNNSKSVSHASMCQNGKHNTLSQPRVTHTICVIINGPSHHSSRSKFGCKYLLNLYPCPLRLSFGSRAVTCKSRTPVGHEIKCINKQKIGSQRKLRNEQGWRWKIIKQPQSWRRPTIDTSRRQSF